MVYRFGPFTLDTASFRLLNRENPMPMTPQSLEVLSYLVQRPQTLVTKDQLFKAVWRDVIVTDNALTQVVSDLRQAIGDDPSKPRYIQTVARRGYRFVASVIGEEPEPVTRPLGPHRAKETPSLDAYRLFTEGRIRLESLESAEIATAIQNFKQAIELDPSYAPPYIGLANAHFWQYESSRYRADVDPDLLAVAIKEARCGQRIDGLIGEAHATLAYLLTAADQLEDARAAARRAIALEPDRWAHHFRFAHAAWGEDRLRALQRCCELYAEFSFAYFQIAMVYVARNELALAEQALRRGVTVQDGDAARRRRFPANGLHWLLGLIRLRCGDFVTATGEFEQEIQRARGQLYATEFEIAARTSWAFAHLAEDRVERAIEMFRASLGVYAIQPRAQLGLALAFARKKEPGKSEDAVRVAEQQICAIERAGRASDSALFTAGISIARGRPATALSTLCALVSKAPPESSGWLIPIDPLFTPLQEEAGYAELLATLAARAH